MTLRAALNWILNTNIFVLGAIIVGGIIVLFFALILVIAWLD